MTRQATLGPIDPNVNTPLNPQIPGAGPNARVGVSVESIKGYVNLAREEFGISNSSDMSNVLRALAEQVHPLVLGNVFRARYHIRMLATKLLEKQFDREKDAEKIESIVSFLCSDSGSHDYTINRIEAKEALGLSIEKPDDELYNLLKSIYDDFTEELELRNNFNPAVLVAKKTQQEYTYRRALIESLYSDKNVFISEGVLIKNQQQTSQGIKTQVQDQRTFEGWRIEKE
jgi:hypothetical protein